MANRVRRTLHDVTNRFEPGFEELPARPIAAPPVRSAWREILPLLAIGVTASFLAGIGLGGRLGSGTTGDRGDAGRTGTAAARPGVVEQPSRAPSILTPSTSAGAGAISTPRVDVDLWSAYLAQSPRSWALCSIDPVATSARVQEAEDPEIVGDLGGDPTVPDAVWAALIPAEGPIGHLVLVGTRVPHGALAGDDPTIYAMAVGANGRTAPIDAAHVAWSDRLWIDLGTLPAGRYLIVAREFGLYRGNSGIETRIVDVAVGIEVTSAGP